MGKERANKLILYVHTLLFMQNYSDVLHLMNYITHCYFSNVTVAGFR
jgi:hypothetical protein